MREHLGAVVFETVVPRNVRLSEAPSHGLPISRYDATLRRQRRLLRSRQGGRLPWLARRLWARAWALSSATAERRWPRRGRRGPPARAAARRDRGQPPAAAAHLRRGRARRARRVHPAPRRRAAGRRAAAGPGLRRDVAGRRRDRGRGLAGRRERGPRRRSGRKRRAGGRRRPGPLRADRRRATPARRPARRPRHDPGPGAPVDEVASLEIALAENVAREDLNCIEEAHAYAALVDEFGLTHERVAELVGRSRVARHQSAAPARAARRCAASWSRAAS